MVGKIVLLYIIEYWIASPKNAQGFNPVQLYRIIPISQGLNPALPYHIISISQG